MSPTDVVLVPDKRMKFVVIVVGVQWLPLEPCAEAVKEDAREQRIRVEYGALGVQFIHKGVAGLASGWMPASNKVVSVLVTVFAHWTQGSMTTGVTLLDLVHRQEIMAQFH